LSDITPIDITNWKNKNQPLLDGGEGKNNTMFPGHEQKGSIAPTTHREPDTPRKNTATGQNTTIGGHTGAAGQENTAAVEHQIAIGLEMNTVAAGQQHNDAFEQSGAIEHTIKIDTELASGQATPIGDIGQSSAPTPTQNVLDSQPLGGKGLQQTSPMGANVLDSQPLGGKLQQTSPMGAIPIKPLGYTPPTCTNTNETNAPGLLPPTINRCSVVGANTDHLRKVNKTTRIAKQRDQLEEPTWWSTHKGAATLPSMPPNLTAVEHQMLPQGLALQHPAAATLLNYATGGCPTNTGGPWTTHQMQAAIDRGPHVSALLPDAAAQLDQEVEQKVQKGQAKLVAWNDIRHDPPTNLKISPVAMIPHKSRAYRAILDLSFSLRLSPMETIPSVNSTTIKTAPKGAVSQLGHSLGRIIHAFAAADESSAIFLAKWDIKDGFWRLECQAGEEWSFAYVLPSSHGKNPILVVPTSLQMGWIESPPYFCAASETARDVATQYCELPVGSLPGHQFLPLTHGHVDQHTLAESNHQTFAYVIEVYVDDFIGLVIPTSKTQLDHVASSVMYGIHDIFPPATDASDDPISQKKLLKGDGQWANVKEVLGLTFDGIEKTIWLSNEKRDALLTTLKRWRRLGTRKGGIPFSEFETTLAKLQHAFITIPAGRGLLSPFYTVIRVRPRFIFLHRNAPLANAVTNCKTFLRESVATPTKCKNLVTAWPDYVGITDASAHGAGGIIIGENMGVAPTVFRLQWPLTVTQNVVSDQNPAGGITNSDLEMAGLLLLWLVMEEVCPTVTNAHVALFSDNSPTVHWVQRLAAKHSMVAMQLIRALALRLQITRTSPLVPLHIAGVDNAMTDIPSRSFGSEPKWHCKTNDEFLTLFNKTFPLPSQESWTLYQLSSAISMKVISILRMQVFTMDAWRKLPKIGKNIGTVGSPTLRLWEWTLSYKKQTTSAAREHSQDLLRRTSQIYCHALAVYRTQLLSTWQLGTYV
jgi:hypothetical protein